MKSLVALTAVCLLLGALSLSACGFPAWRDQLMRDVVEGRWHAIPSQIPAGGQGSQTVEFYDAGGRRVRYGVISGGAVNVYGPDGSRAGYGRAGR